MELTALKSVLKDMGIEFEKFHTRNQFHNQKTVQKINDRKEKKLIKIKNPKDCNEKNSTHHFSYSINRPVF
jgi:predicted  nucleic acid-binding Zn-ribbon protein